MGDLRPLVIQLVGLLAGALCAGCGGAAPQDLDGGPHLAVDAGAPASPFIVEVVRFTPGPGAGFGEVSLVLGPPHGGGDGSGSTDVLSLGVGGEIVVELGRDIVDGPGADLLVFENAFAHAGGVFAEPGAVGASADGVEFSWWTCQSEGDGEGCAGLTPVYAHPDGEIDPLDPTSAGGDGFDLGDLGLDRARFVAIQDQGVGPAGDVDNAGFDLDAMAAVHDPVAWASGALSE